MEEKREVRFLSDDTSLYENAQLDEAFMEAIGDVCLALQEAGFEPFDQLTGYVRTGNDQYITRRGNARKIVTEMDPDMIKQYLKRYGHINAMRK